MSPSELAIQ